MKNIILTGTDLYNSTSQMVIYCPCLIGLNVMQVDLAMIMPRVNNNQALLTAPRPVNRCFAGVLTSDPFTMSDSYYERLLAHGYKGVVNWPSSILLEGQTKVSMQSISATPEQEYLWLAKAKKWGLQTMAVFNNLEQAHAAIKSGLKDLILHPGIFTKQDIETGQRLPDQIISLMKLILSEQPDVSITIYARHLAVDEFVDAEFRNTRFLTYEAGAQ